MSEVAIDLASRWRRARRSALRSTLADEPAIDDGAEGAIDDAIEEELLARALERSPQQVLRAVFDVSRRLGEGFRRYYRLDLPAAQLAELLPQLGSPCLAARWERTTDEPVYVAARAGCDAVTQHPRACDYWREAIEGLVLGITGAVRHARHHSVGHGGARCVDVLYVRPESAARFGPIPDDVGPGLESLRRTVRAFDTSIDVEFLGISEGQLYYRSERADGATGGLRVNAMLEQGVRRRFPWLTPRDVSPRAVLTPGED